MPRDPLDPWPNEQRWIWPTVACWVALLRSAGFLEAVRLRSPLGTGPDFFQEYASAQSWLDGRAINADHH